MSKLFHPNIVLYMGACSEPGNLMIVTERMDGDLEQLLLNKSIHLSLCKRMQMAKQWYHCASDFLYCANSLSIARSESIGCIAPNPCSYIGISSHLTY